MLRHPKNEKIKKAGRGLHIHILVVFNPLVYIIENIVHLLCYINQFIKFRKEYM